MPVAGAIMGAKIARGVAKRVIGRRGRSTRSTRRRGRRARLTAREREELLWIKNTIGKTAAANYLGSYLSRGG